jgi:hypothetical protein
MTAPHVSTVTPGENGEQRHMLATKADALALVRRLPSGACFYLHVSIDAPLFDEPDKIYRDMIFGSIKISRATAEKFIADSFRDNVTEKRAALPAVVRQWERRDGKPPRQVLWIG